MGTPRRPISGRIDLFKFGRIVQRSSPNLAALLDWDALDLHTISAFLGHLEADRHNSARTRNVRLGALRSLFRYASLQHPEQTGLRVSGLTGLNRADIMTGTGAHVRCQGKGRKERAIPMIAISSDESPLPLNGGPPFGGPGGGCPIG